MRFFRPTLRVRMALLYGGLVLLVGVSLLFTCVILLDKAIVTPKFHVTAGTQILDPHNNPISLQQATDQERTDAIHYLIKTGLLYFSIIIVIGTTGGYLLAKQALRPIAKLTQTARALSTETR